MFELLNVTVPVPDPPLVDSMNGLSPYVFSPGLFIVSGAWFCICTGGGVGSIVSIGSVGVAGGVGDDCSEGVGDDCSAGVGDDCGVGVTGNCVSIGSITSVGSVGSDDVTGSGMGERIS